MSYGFTPGSTPNGQTPLTEYQRYMTSWAPAVRGLLLQILQDELQHVQWIQMALGGQIPGSSVDYGGALGSVHQPHSGREALPQTTAYGMGQVVIPMVAHMPEHIDKAARVVGIVQNQPFYVLDFGNGRPHRWYAQEELEAAPQGVQAGQTVPGATREGTGHGETAGSAQATRPGWD